jgi:hypothetical protein
LVEQRFCKPPVVGSSPITSSAMPGIGITHIERLMDMGRYQSGQLGQTVNLLSIDFAGSNPALPTDAGVTQLVECQPSKLNVASSSLVARSMKIPLKAAIAQSVERIHGKDEVIGSNPISGSRPTVFHNPNSTLQRKR